MGLYDVDCDCIRADERLICRCVHHGSEATRNGKDALLRVHEMLRGNAGRAWCGGIEQEG